jgi:hypothetical protein
VRKKGRDRGRDTDKVQKRHFIHFFGGGEVEAPEGGVG